MKFKYQSMYTEEDHRKAQAEFKKTHWKSEAWIELLPWMWMASVIGGVYYLFQLFPMDVHSGEKGYWWGMAYGSLLWFGITKFLFGFTTGEDLDRNNESIKGWLSPVGQHVYDNYTEYQAIAKMIKKLD